MFQSSPAPKDGRYDERPRLPQAVQLFQSSPAPKDGRYETGCDSELRTACVSILARPEGRALPARAPHSCPHDACFNPRPPRGTGATAAVAKRSPNQGFNPRPPRRTGATSFCAMCDCGCSAFQSSPAPRDGRYGRYLAGYVPTHQFQSSPAPRDGRYFAAATSPIIR